MTVTEYLGKIREEVGLVGIAWNVFSNKEKVQQTLNELGLEFHVFIITFEVLPALHAFEQEKLLQHDMNMKQKGNGLLLEAVMQSRLLRFLPHT